MVLEQNIVQKLCLFLTKQDTRQAITSQSHVNVILGRTFLYIWELENSTNYSQPSVFIYKECDFFNASASFGRQHFFVCAKSITD